MKIRTRLFLLILPIVLVIVLAMSYLTYFTWYHDTLEHFRTSLEALSTNSQPIINKVIEEEARKLQGFVLIGAILTIIFVTCGIAFVANKISQPVEQLKNAALSLAAGNYGKKIEVDGPKEITELSNTFNTMSECLREHLQRLEESSLVREKMIGEVECFRILQTKIVQGVADKFTHPQMRLKAIGIPARSPHTPTVLEILENKEDKVVIRFKEATQSGFDGIYELIEGKEVSSFITGTLEKKGAKSFQFESKEINMPKPFLWLAKKQEVVANEKEALIEAGDLIIFVNRGLNELMIKDGIVNNWFSRIFRHFADEGLSSCMTLLANELAFLSQRNDLKSPLQAICIEIEKA